MLAWSTDMTPPNFTILRLLMTLLFFLPALTQAEEETSLLQALPNPGDKPKFNRKFRVIVKGGNCSKGEQEDIMGILKNTRQLAEQLLLWNVKFHRAWQQEFEYCLGKRHKTAKTT